MAMPTLQKQKLRLAEATVTQLGRDKAEFKPRPISLRDPCSVTVPYA